MNNFSPTAGCFVLLKHNFLPFSLVDTRSADVSAGLIYEYINTNRSIYVCTINAEIAVVSEWPLFYPFQRS